MGKKKRRNEKKQQFRSVEETRHTEAVHQERQDAAKRRQMKVYRTYAYVFIAVLVVAGLVYAAWPKPSELDDFALCLTEQGAAMYGADWCNHCQEQKRRFGSSFRYVDYKNCDFSDICQQQGVTSFPTWIFEDGSRVSGVQELSSLSNRTGCMLPPVA